MKKAYFAAAYISIVWLTYCFTIHFGDWTGVPLYILLAPIVFLVVPEAIVTVLSLAGILLLYETTKLLQPGFVPSFKGYAGLVVLSAALPLCYFCLKALGALSDKQLGLWLRFLLILMFVCILIDQLLGVMGITKSDYPHYFLPIDRRPGILFTEPSFLALSLGPFIFTLIYNPKLFLRYLGVSSAALIVVICVMCPSATLVGVTMLAGVTAIVNRVLKGRTLGIIGGGILLIVLGTAIMAVPEIAERFMGVFDSNSNLQEQNMSSLIFIKGREMAAYAIQHFPLGVSFMDMEVLVPKANVVYISNVLYDLNSNDGSSILFKGVCELGVLFISITIMSLWRFLNGMHLDKGDSLFYTLILAFQFSAFSHFIRGSSYFDGVVSIGLSIFFLDTMRGALGNQVRKIGTALSGSPRRRQGRPEGPSMGPRPGRRQPVPAPSPQRGPLPQRTRPSGWIGHPPRT